MKKSIHFLLLSIFLFPVLVSAQSVNPQKDIDYKFSYSLDEKGDGYNIYSYYLENIGSENIMFYNFNYPEGRGSSEILVYFQNVIILKPSEKKQIIKFKTYSTAFKVNWVASFMTHKDDTENPDKNIDYVFYYEYQQTGDNFTYSYFLKNISSKPILVYDFIILGETTDYEILKDVPYAFKAIKPEESILIMKYSIANDKTTPSVNWYAKYIVENESSYYNFNPVEYDFCEGVKKILEASRSGFEDIFGPVKTPEGKTLLDFEKKYSKIHIKGLNTECIENILFWDYVGYIGKSDKLSEIETRMKLYQGKIKECLPDMTELVKDSESLTYEEARAEYDGEIDDYTHHLELSIVKDYSNEGHYFLRIMIEEVF